MGKTDILSMQNCKLGKTGLKERKQDILKSCDTACTIVEQAGQESWAPHDKLIVCAQHGRVALKFVTSVSFVALILLCSRASARVEIPETVADLQAIEEQVVQSLRQIMPATVAVSLNRSQASGVIVSQDGYVLTASHVSGLPGQRVTITFSDGRRVQGETLGTNPDVDGSLIRITTPGIWPFAPIVPDDEAPELGDWCIATGHPGGFDPTRTPPVRVGRVIRSDKYVLRTDCPITGGDSGGPLFDLKGRVIGIHSRISEDPTDNLHVPVGTYRRTWDKLTAGRIGHVSPRSKFLAAFDVDQDGSIDRSEIPKGMYRDVYDRLSKQFKFDASKPQDIEKLRSRVNLKLTPDIDSTTRQSVIFEGPAREIPQLAKVAFTRGDVTMQAFRSPISKIRSSVVELRHKGRLICLGTVVDNQAHIITKASELPRDEKNRVKDIVAVSSTGRKLEAEYLTWHAEFDVALLKLKVKKSRPVKWQEPATTQVGQWIISSGTARVPVSVGALSVLGRTIPKGPGFLGVVRSENPGRAAGAKVGKVLPESVAQRAGFEPGDVITQVNGITIGSFADLQRLLGQYRTTDKVELRYTRRRKPNKVTVRLGSRAPNSSINPTERMNGEVSARRTAFPIVMQHDSVIAPNEVGGPIVDLEGNVVGINIARPNRTATYAIPAARAKLLVTELKNWAARKGK